MQVLLDRTIAVDRVVRIPAKLSVTRLLNRQAERTEEARWQLQSASLVDAVPAPVGIALTVVETLDVGPITAFIIVVGIRGGA